MSTRIRWAWTLEFLDSPAEGLEFKFWAGEGDLSIGGSTFKGTNGVIAIEPPEESAGVESVRLRATMSATDPNIRKQLRRDIGPLRIKVQFIYADSEASDPAWKLSGKQFIGRLSAPVLQGATYAVDVESMVTDLDRGRERIWSDDNQRARYPGDRGFEFLADYEAKGVDTKWPTE